jgi:NitT/TauT family transport system substrate-binding protein
MFRSLLLAGLSALCLAAPAWALDHITYELDWLPSGEETFPYIAQHEGLFQKQGLDVTIAIGRGSSDVLTKISTGAGQVASGGISTLMAGSVEHKLPAKAILSIFTRQPDAIFTTPQSGIKTIKDLAGHTLVTATFTSSNVLWPVVAQAAGLDPASVTLIKVDPAALGGMLASGRADAMINWVTGGPEIADVLAGVGKQLVVLPWSDSGLSGYGLSLFASDAIIAGNPDLLTRFVRAYAEGIARSIADCDKAGADQHAEVPEVDAKISAEQCRTTIPLIRNEITARDGMGNFTRPQMDETWDWIARAQSYKKDQLDPMSVVNTSFVPKAAQ